MIGVTGATGHLGQAILRYLPAAIPLGRELPTTGVHAVIHTACPNWRDDTAVTLFDLYNTRLSCYIRKHDVRTVINIGTWWQYAEGNCTDLPYTLQKHRQTRMLEWTGANVTTVIPYSIYGDDPRPGRGFIPQLVKTLTTGEPLVGLSNQPRDFIHVTDVALACIAALDATPATYTAATRRPESPYEIATRYGVSAPDYAEYPTATPVYLHPPVPNWSPVINVDDHIRRLIL